MPKRKPTKPDRYDPKARSFGGLWRMVKCKDGAYVCYEQHMEIVDSLRKSAEINPAQSPHDGIHTCSKGCNKPGCNRGLRDTIEEQDAQIVALKQDLLEQSAAARHLRMERIHDLNHIGGLQEEVARLRSQFANSEWQPIETAPKDGTAVLIRCVMRWDKDAQGWGYFQDASKAAEWMPLPKPPQA